MKPFHKILESCWSVLLKLNERGPFYTLAISSNVEPAYKTGKFYSVSSFIKIFLVRTVFFINISINIYLICFFFCFTFTVAVLIGTLVKDFSFTVEVILLALFFMCSTFEKAYKSLAFNF